MSALEPSRRDSASLTTTISYTLYVSITWWRCQSIHPRHTSIRRQPSAVARPFHPLKRSCIQAAMRAAAREINSGSKAANRWTGQMCSDVPAIYVYIHTYIHKYTAVCIRTLYIYIYWSCVIMLILWSLPQMYIDCHALLICLLFLLLLLLLLLWVSWARSAGTKAPPGALHA